MLEHTGTRLGARSLCVIPCDGEQSLRAELGEHALGERAGLDARCAFDDAHAHVVALVVEARCEGAREWFARRSDGDVRDCGRRSRRRRCGPQPANRVARTAVEPG